MKRTTKLICILLVLFTLLSIFTSCEKKRKEGDPPVFTSDKTVVMKLGDYNVKRDFYRYLFLNAKALADKGDDSYWEKDGHSIEQLKDEVLESLKKTYAMFTLADKYSVTLSEEEKLEVKNQIENMKNQYGADFKNELKNNYLTEELLKFTLEVEMLESALIKHIITGRTGILKTDDESVENAIKTEYVVTKQILIKFEDNVNNDTKLATAKEALDRLNAGEDFDSLISEYSDDTNVSANKYGYYFRRGMFLEEIEEAAFNMDIGKHSEIIKTNVGYHIIKRIAINNDYVNEQFETLRMKYLESKYNDMLVEVIENLEHEYQGKFTDITLTTFD